MSGWVCGTAWANAYDVGHPQCFTTSPLNKCRILTNWQNFWKEGAAMPGIPERQTYCSVLVFGPCHFMVGLLRVEEQQVPIATTTVHRCR